MSEGWEIIFGGDGSEPGTAPWLRSPTSVWKVKLNVIWGPRGGCNKCDERSTN